MALNYVNATVEGDNPAVAYATVYPLSMIYSSDFCSVDSDAFHVSMEPVSILRTISLRCREILTQEPSFIRM